MAQSRQCIHGHLLLFLGQGVESDNAETLHTSYERSVQREKLLKQIAALENEREKLLGELSGLAAELSERRKTAAAEISRGVEKELDDLRMPSARFEVQMETVPDEGGLTDGKGNRLEFSDSGFDRVEFLIAPNPGEGMKPLAKVASGGETSRLMLALKNTLAQADTIPTMVFDEIDKANPEIHNMLLQIMDFRCKDYYNP